MILKQHYGKNDWITHTTDSLFDYTSIKHLFSTYRWNGIFLSTLNNWRKTEAIPEDGYYPVAASPRDSINVHWSIKNAINTANTGYEVNDSFHVLIDHLQALCDEHGVKLICFTSPSYPALSTDLTWKLLIEYFYQKDIAYVHYPPEDLEVLNDVWLWKDKHHLNSEGAQLYSRLIRSALTHPNY